MTDSRERLYGWEDRLLADCRDLFSTTAERHSLQIEWDEAAPVEVACTYPKQAGLDFSVWMSLSDDEFSCGGEDWSAHIFPADLPLKWELITKIVDGLVTGDARITLYRAIGWHKPFWTVLQLRNGDRWLNVSTGVGCALPPVFKRVVRQNGNGKRQGRIGFAWGSLLCLLLLAWGLKAVFW